MKTINSREIALPKVLEYNALQEQVADILTEEGQTNKIIFSIFRSVGESSTDSWLVAAPDLTSQEPLYKGKVRFIAPWENYRSIQPVKNPTWKDVLREANQSGNGDHIYLESITFKMHGEEIVGELFFGS